MKKQNKKLEPCEEIGIFKLNFDCLVHIISFLELKDLANLDQVSDHFQPITEHLYTKYKSFDCKSISPVTFYDGRITLDQIGSYISSIKIDQNDLNTNCYDFLELVLILCPNLENIRIEDITLDRKTLKRIKNLFLKLKSIELINCCLDDSIGEYLATAKFLEKLNLRRNEKINGSCISNLKNLVSLNLSRCDNIQPDFLINHTNLVQLNIIQSQLTPSSVTYITTNLLNIEELSISTSYDNLTSNDFLLFANLPKLKKLKIKRSNSTNTDDLFVKLGEMDFLQSLNISEVTISKKVIDALVSFTKLEILKMNDVSFRNFDLSQLQIKENIKELHLRNCYGLTTPALISFVENSPNIRVLHLNGCGNITNDFYYSVLASLKEQNRKHYLTMTIFNYDTSMNENEIDSKMINDNLPWIQLKFLYDDELPIDEDVDVESVKSYEPISDEGKFFLFLLKVTKPETMTKIFSRPI